MGVLEFFRSLFSGNNSSTPVNTNTNTSNLSGTNSAQNGRPRVSTPTNNNVSSYNLAGTNNIQNAGGTVRNTPRPSQGPYLPNQNKPVSTNPYEAQVNAKKYQKELSEVADESNRKAQSVLNTIGGAVGAVTNKAGEVVQKISDTGKANQDYYTQRQQNLKAKSLKENQDRRDNDVKSITQDEIGKMYNADGSQTDLDTREKELKEAITSVRMNMSNMDQENFNLIDYEYQNNQLQSLQGQLDEVQNLKRKRESLEENYILGQMRATGDPNLEGYEEMLSHKEDNLAERFGTSMAHLLTNTANEIPSIIDQAIYASNFDPAKKNIEELVEKNKNGELSDDALAEAYALYEKDILEYKDRFDASVSQAVNDVASQLNANTFYGADDIEKFVLQAGESTAQFLLHYAVGTTIAGNFVNGLGAVRDVGGQIATGTMSLASTTDKFNQLIAQGYDPDIAMKNAVATGLVSYMVEKVGMDRFVGMLGTPVSVDAMGEIIKNILQSGLSEGLEEAVESMVDTVVDNSILGEYEFNNSELLMEFLLGGASGLAMATGATARSAVGTAIETFQNVNAYVEANANLRDALVEQVGMANTEANEFVVKTRHQRNSLQNQMNLLRERMPSMTDTQKAVAVQEIEKAVRSIQTYDSMTATAGITLQEDIAEPIIPGQNDKLVLESWSVNFNNDVQAMNRLNELQAEVVQNAEDLKVKRAEADEKTQAILDENGYDIDATAFNNLSDEGKKKALASIDFARAIGIELELVDNLDPLENGKFVNGKVVLDISKTIKGKSTIISTLAHELTHRNEYSESFYPKLKEIVQKHLGDMWDSAVQNKILDYENVGKELTPEQAEKEVVAEAIEDLFENEDFLDDLIRYDYSFIERSLQGLRNIVGNTYENKVKRAFEKAFREVNEKSIVFTENKAQMSVGQYQHNGRELFGSYLDDKIEKGQLTEDDKKDILKRLDEIAQVMRDFEATGEFPATSNWNDQFYEIGENGDLSVVISNGDYDLNIDFSTVCKKRKMMDKVLNQLAKAGYLTKKLTNTQLETLREVIKENELEVACGLCFVDAKRFNQGNWAGKFELKWNGIIDHIAGVAGIEDISYFDFAHGKVGVSEQLANLVISEDDPRFSELFSKAQGNSEEARMIRAIVNDPSLRSKVTSQDMYGSESFGAMKGLMPSLYKLVNASGGASKPKLPHAEINYRHEIAFSNKFNEESARRVGGVRCQSFSDFMVNMVFDYMEMFADLEAKNLPAHSYTKVKEYGLLFGKTGMKINLSIIPAGFDRSVYTAEEIADIRKNNSKLYRQLRENAGLDANGNYIFDEESFGESKDKENGYGWKLAIEMQNLEGYDKNVGTICVGVSDKHIFKLLADPNVCMIIPYHRSGIDSVIAEKMGVHVFNDYTLKQNTRFRKENGRPGTKVGSGFEFDFYGGSDFNGKHFGGMIENGYDAKKTADQYLAWCKEHNYVPKFDAFAGDPNYYKLLVDFRAYDKNGNIAPQEAVNISKDESVPSFSDVIDATKNPELFEMYGDNIAFENVLQNGLRAYEDTDALQNEKLDPITEEFIRRAKLTQNTVGTSDFVNKTIGDMSWDEFNKKKYDRDFVKQLKQNGIKSNEDMRNAWIASKFAGFSSEDAHELSKDEAYDIIYDRIPENILWGWYRNADSGYKEKIETLVLQDKELRNAGLNIMYDNYKNIVDKDISFNEFLNKEVTMFRGTRGQEAIDKDVFMSYSLDEKTAGKFGEDIGTIKVKPIDTLGSYQTNLESEVLVPRRIVDGTQYSVAGDAGLSRLQKWLTDTDANGDLVNGNNPKYADIQAKYKEMTAKRAEARQMRDAFKAGDYEKYGLTYADVTTLINNARYMPEFERERRGNYPVKLKTNEENLKRAVLEEVIRQKTGWIMPMDPREKRGEGAEFYDDGLIDRLTGYLMGLKIVGPAKNGSSVPYDPNHPNKKCDYLYPGEFKDPSLKKIGDFDDSGLLGIMYPDAMDIPVKAYNNTNNPGSCGYTHLDPFTGEADGIGVNQAIGGIEAKDTMAHEIQHVIQTAEHWQNGAGLSGRSEEAWSRYLNTPGERDARAEGWRQVHDVDRYDPNKPWTMPQPTPAPKGQPQTPQTPQAPQLSPPYLYKGPDSGRTAQVLDEAPERKKSNWKDFQKKIRHDFVDHFDRIEDLSRKYKNPKLIAKADFSMLAPAFANDALFNKRHKIGTSDEIGESLQSILDKVKPEDMQTFGEFMYHYRNLDATSMVQRLGKEYMAEKFIKEHGVMGTFNSYANPQDFLYYIDEAERTLSYEELMKNKTYVAWKQFLAPKPVFGRAITNAESQARIDEILAQHPEYNDIAEQLWEYETQNLEVLKDAGVLTQEMYDQFRKETPHYVPIQRAVNSEYNGADSMDPNKAIKKFKGSDQDIYPLAYNMVKHTYDVYKTALQNNLHAEIYNTLKQPKGTTITSETDSEEDNEIMDADAVMESLSDNFVPIQEQEKGHYKMYAYINGERKRVGISKELYDSLSPRRVDTPDIPLANTISEFRRNLITSYSLPFMFSNFFKDMQDAGYNTKYSLPKYYANYVRAFGEVFGNGKVKKLYLANGGGESSYFHEIGDRKERSNWNPLKWVIWLNDQVEMVPRLAEFMCAQQAGKSIEESMYEASEVTTNFKRGGAKAKYLNRNGVTFFNASIQGFAKQARNFKDAKDGGAKAMATYMAKIALLSGMPLVLLNGLVWRDDKDYEELSDYVKENYYIVGKAGNRFIRIPKGRLSAFYQTVMTNGIKTVKGQVDVWDALVDSVQSFADNIAPNNPSDNFILSPLLQAYSTPEGRTWYHEDLVPSSLQNRLNEDQYDASTDIVSIWIGKQLKASPYKINYVLDQYTGGAGDIVLPMLALQANNGVNNKFLSAIASPWIDKFSTDPVLKNQNVSGLYTLKDELEKIQKSVSATDEQLLSYKYLSVVSGKMGELYTKIKEVQGDPSLSNGEKYDKVRELKKQINDFAREGLNNYDQIDIYGNYAEVGGVQYYMDKNGEWKKMTKTQIKNMEKTGLEDTQKGAYYESFNAIQEAREEVKGNTPAGQDADYRQVTIDLIKNSDMDAKTKNVMFDYYYPSKFTEAVNSMDYDDDTKLNIKFAKTMAEGKKDANGKTIANSKALATADAYADMGVLEDIIKYIKQTGIDPSTMGLSKTVLGYSYKQLSSKYQQIFNEVFGDGKPFDTGSSGSSSGKSKKSGKSGKSSRSSRGSKKKKTKTPTGKRPKAYNMIGKLGIDYKPKLVDYNNNYANAYANMMRKTRPGGNDLVTCPKCGNRVSASSGRCPICGAQL